MCVHWREGRPCEWRVCVRVPSVLGQVRSISRNNRGVTKAAALTTYKSTVKECLHRELGELGVPPMAFPILFVDALGACIRGA